jgi:hypothetical protein
VDLLQSDRNFLLRYMGREESREFLRYHASRKLGLEPPDDLQEKPKPARSA